MYAFWKWKTFSRLLKIKLLLNFLKSKSIITVTTTYSYSYVLLNAEIIIQ